jgi:signal transduction histidine kinase
VTTPGPRPGSPSLHATRVAAIAALLTAVLYLGVIIPFDVVDAGHLVAQVDSRLAGRLNRVALVGYPRRPARGFPSSDDDVDRAPIVIWRAGRRGVAVPVTAGAFPLPAGAWSHTGQPVSAATAGGDFRLIAMRASAGWLVAGESLAETQHVEAVVGRAELIAGPVVVLAMFFGALAIGLMASHPLEQARRRQLEFTADASHELRTPIAVIDAEVALGLTSRRDGASYRATLYRIGKEGKRLRHIVEDLLFLARFDAKPPVPTHQLVDLVTLAGVSVQRFAAAAKSKNIRLSLETLGADASIDAPPEWVDRLVGVLIDNACRYAGEGRTVTVVVSTTSKVVSLAVEDNGPGVPPEQRPFLFDRFQRSTSGDEGAGLGLAIADAVVRSTDGKWRVADTPGGGAHMEVLWRKPRAWAGSS